MTTICRCGANDAAIEGRCLPCHRDYLSTQKAAEQARAQVQIDAAAARRLGRPAWRPDTSSRGHGLGRGRHCGQYGRSGS